MEQVIKAIGGIESKIEGYKTNMAELSDRVFQLEQKGGAGGMFDAGVTRSPASLGEQVIKSFDSNRELFEKTRSVRLEIKAAGDAITTASGRNLVMAGVGVPMGAVLGFQNALPNRSQGGASAVEYSRYTGQEGAAAVQAGEGADKPAVRPTHTIITQNALTIAGYTKMSRQALNDSQELKRAVDVVLARSVATSLDTTLITGSVTPAFDGFSTLATAATSTAYSALPDAVSEGVATMQTQGFEPDVVALHPLDWLAITVAKGTANDHYLSGSYLGVMPKEMRGLRVVLSPTIAQGKALVMDSRHSELLTVDGFSVEVAYSGDDFTKNLVTVLGEMRVIPIFRTVGSARLVTPAP